jgi:diguanylate cyclase (GGDEF)-like protein
MDIRSASVPETSAPAHSMQAFNAVRQSRMRRVLRTVLVVLTSVALTYIFKGNLRTGGLLLIASLVLIPSYYLNERKKVHLAADMMLWTLTITFGFLALLNQGLRDTALMAYPGLLVFAILLWRDRTLWGLIAGQVSIAFLIWGLDASGLLISRVESAGAMQILDIAAVVGLTAFAAWLIAADQRNYLKALTQEHVVATTTLQKLEHSIRHDALTSLPNRRAATEALQVLCDHPVLNAHPTAVLLINLDHFKSINESLGPSVGDDYLVHLCSRMESFMQPGEQLFRVGSDEFLLVEQQHKEQEFAMERAQQWIQTIAQPINLSGVDISITASAGMVVFPIDGNTPKELLMRADMAMQGAKEAGRNSVSRYDGGEAVAQTSDHLRMLADMRKALLSGEFSLHFQPKFLLSTSELCGAEVLLRWRHPSLGYVSPATFIPLAEKSGFIVELGSWVLQEACRQIGRWRAAGLTVPPIAINVSMVQFRRGNLRDLVYRSLQESQIPGSALELELTESLLSDSLVVVQSTLDQLRRLGVTLAIDDFGTGYSNLGYLKQFEIQTLKIDQSFVRKVCTSPPDQAIVRAIVNMATQLDLNTVAEGIETAEVAQILKELGCEIGQGYLWSPALATVEFEKKYLQQPTAS